MHIALKMKGMVRFASVICLMFTRVYPYSEKTVVDTTGKMWQYFFKNKVTRSTFGALNPKSTWSSLSISWRITHMQAVYMDI